MKFPSGLAVNREAIFTVIVACCALSGTQKGALGSIPHTKI
jgi:hypothetical protein